jgi:hypothetical protein
VVTGDESLDASRRRVWKPPGDHGSSAVWERDIFIRNLGVLIYYTGSLDDIEDVARVQVHSASHQTGLIVTVV